MKHNYLYLRWIIGLLLILPFDAHATEENTPPSAELLQYLVEFSDAQGEMMEPEMLMTVSEITEAEMEKISANATSVDGVSANKLRDEKAAVQADEVQP
ncbi:hypothetical protein [Cellvibrio sp.]